MERNDPTIKMKEKIYKELKVNFLSIEQQIKELEDHKAECLMKCDLYGQCLSEHLLDSGSENVKKHLAQTHADMEKCDRDLEDLRLERDAYRIEIEVYESNIK